MITTQLQPSGLSGQRRTFIAKPVFTVTTTDFVNLRSLAGTRSFINKLIGKQSTIINLIGRGSTQ